jgi:hypothetical protein
MVELLRLMIAAGKSWLGLQSVGIAEVVTLQRAVCPR